MVRILAFNVPAHGHVNPSLPVVAELVRRGHQVNYYCTPEFQNRIEVTGATFRAYPNIRDDELERHWTDVQVVHQLAMATLEMTEDLLPWTLEVIDQEKPDLILHDSMCAWGWYAAKIAGMAHVSSTALMFLNGRIARRIIHPFEMLRIEIKGMPYLKRYRQIEGVLKQRYGVAGPGYPQIFLTRGTITISYISEMLQPSGATIDNSVKFVGPSIETRPDASNFPFDTLGDKPIVYISLGTLANNHPGFYGECWRAFGDDPGMQVVMSVGSRVDMDSLGTLPANFIVRSSVPQLEILKRASAFITHGGMNSTSEGLFYGVPLVFVPQQAEETVVAARVEELGAGIRVRKKSIDASMLRKTVDRVLSDSRYREKSAVLGESLKQAGGYRRAADEILKLC